jgi:hypothetical protein
LEASSFHRNRQAYLRDSNIIPHLQFTLAYYHDISLAFSIPPQELKGANCTQLSHYAEWPAIA